MLVIGLTGGIGSGKSTVADMFAARGAPIIDADLISREVTLPGETAFNQIIEHFGHAMVSADGSLNRGKLREAVFANSKERIWLEKLLHPLIRQRIEQRLKVIDAAYCIIVIPLLFEVAPYEFIDRILVIDAPERLQIERVTTRDKSEPSHVEAIMKSQTTRSQRLSGADDVIINDGKIADLERQVQKIHEMYITL